MNVEMVNKAAANATVMGWYGGLAYYNWLASHPIHAPLWWHIGLVTVGMMAAAIAIGGGVAVILLAVSRLRIARNFHTHEIVAWGTVISPVLAFLGAGYAL